MVQIYMARIEPKWAEPNGKKVTSEIIACFKEKESKKKFGEEKIKKITGS